jgi:hypothetical protein
VCIPETSLAGKRRQMALRYADQVGAITCDVLVAALVRKLRFRIALLFGHLLLADTSAALSWLRGAAVISTWQNRVTSKTCVTHRFHITCTVHD